MQISKHFKLEEFYRSETARRKNICNIPNEKCIENIKFLALHILEPIREHFNTPLIITSGFRYRELNRIIGGSPASQHILGQAADFIVKNIKLDEVFSWCKENLNYDQLINEHNSWVHISCARGKNRHMAFKILN